MDCDGAEEDQPPDAFCNCSVDGILRTADVDSFELSFQARLSAEPMEQCREMHDDIHAGTGTAFAKTRRCIPAAMTVITRALAYTKCSRARSMEIARWFLSAPTAIAMPGYSPWTG